jgi:hypothetical protein
METELEKINERNKRVELDKAWETSKTRRGIIAIFTYIVACFFLSAIGNEIPHINALVPVGGYLLSTLSLPLLKQWWIKRQTSHE